MQETLLPRLTESIRSSTVVRRSDYDYFVHPLTDGLPSLTPELLDETVQALRARLPADFDRFLTPEAMGLPITTGLSLATGKPFLTARKRAYNLPGEVRVPYRTGYSGGDLHINGLRPGERLVIVDDVVSRGGTLRALVAAAREARARVVKILLVFNKDADLDALTRELGAPIEALATVRIVDGVLRAVP